MRTRTALGAMFALTLGAPGALAGHIFFSFDYTGDAVLGPTSFTDVSIVVQAKGLTDNIVESQSTFGTLFTIPVSMVIALDGEVRMDVGNPMHIFVYSDFGYAGFGALPQQPSFVFITDVLLGFNLTTSVGPTPMPGAGGSPLIVIPTTLGLLSLGNATSNGTFTAIANPAPGTLPLLALGVLSPIGRRRRPPTSG